MTDEELLKKRKQAEVHCRMTWPGLSQENVEEFGSYCVERWLSGTHPNTSFYYLEVDYMRTNIGSCDRRGSPDLILKPGRLKHDLSKYLPLKFGEESKDFTRFENSSILRDPRVSEKHRIILILYYEWEFSQDEIADLLSVNSSRVSQLLKEAKEALRELK